MTVKLLTEHFFEFLSLKVCCTGLSESTLVKIPHCWKSHVTAQMAVTRGVYWCFFMPGISSKAANSSFFKKYNILS